MNKLNYEEFYDYVWGDYISSRVVPDSYIDNNYELIQAMTYDFYTVYDKSPNASESLFAKLVEMTFKNFITFGQFSPDNNDINEAYESF